MRPIHIYDLDAATRVVLAALPDARATTADTIVRAARTADVYRKRLGKAHPIFGSGTLTSATMGMPRGPVSYCDATYRRCLVHVLDALAHHSA